MVQWKDMCISDIPDQCPWERRTLVVSL